jgi:predicted HicB family RNase H-like nuclease
VRPRLGGEAQRGEAPFLHLRVPPELRKRLKLRARAYKVSVSNVVRNALMEYLAT